MKRRKMHKHRLLILAILLTASLGINVGFILFPRSMDGLQRNPKQPEKDHLAMNSDAHEYSVGLKPLGYVFEDDESLLPDSRQAISIAKKLVDGDKKKFLMYKSGAGQSWIYRGCFMDGRR